MFFFLNTNSTYYYEVFEITILSFLLKNLYLNIFLIAHKYSKRNNSNDIRCIMYSRHYYALFPRMRQKKKHCTIILVCFLFNHKKKLDVDFCTVKELYIKLSSSSCLSWLYYSFSRRKAIFLLLPFSNVMLMLVVGI